MQDINNKFFNHNYIYKILILELWTNKKIL